MGAALARIATGRWLAPALALIDRTRTMDAQERRGFLKAECAVGRGGSPQTLHRQMVAAAWIQTRARLYDVALEDVVIAWTGAEALAKLEEARPEHAAAHIRNGLLGRLTSRQLISISSMHPDKRSTLDWPNEWQAFLIDYVHPRFPDVVGNARTGMSEVSMWGKLLSVDAEWMSKDDRNVALYISPKIIYAQGKDLLSIFKSMMTARLYFKVILFFSLDKDELERIALWLSSQQGNLGEVSISCQNG